MNSLSLKRLSGRRRPVPFARHLLSHNKGRTLVASTGIAFALLVVFLQLGFYGAVLHTALAVSDKLTGDLMMISPGFVYLGETGTIPKARLYQAMNQPEVESTTPIYFRYADWRDPATGERCRLFALGFPLAGAAQSPPLDLPGLGAQIDALRPGNTLLLDRRSQPSCGPRDGSREVEVRGQASRMVGDFDLGVGFLADGAFLVSDQTFSRIYDNHPLDKPHLGLIRLKPGSDPQAVANAMREDLPSDVRIVTREDLNSYQTEHWVSNTAAGNVFGLGSIAGFVVGLVVLFEILSTDIRNQLPFYATLMAMGYSYRRLVVLVLQQAWFFALLGYIPALAISSLVFPFVESKTQLPIYLTTGLTLSVFVLAIFMCSGAAALSTLRLRRAAPAELF